MSTKWEKAESMGSGLSYRPTRSWLSLSRGWRRARGCVCEADEAKRIWRCAQDTLPATFTVITYIFVLIFFATLFCVFYILFLSLFFPILFLPSVELRKFLHLPPLPDLFSPCGSSENRLYFYIYGGYPGVCMYLMTYIYLTTRFSIRFKSHSIFLSSPKTRHRFQPSLTNWTPFPSSYYCF